VAEETLVKEALTEGMIRGGASLTSKLDESGWPIVGAFWLFDPEENHWKLMIVSPEVTTRGPREAYEAISVALAGLPHHFTDLQYITVIAPSHPLVRALATAVKTGRAIEAIRFSRQALAGRFIDEIYLYRLLPEATAA
jgi:hypothetical protein